MWPLRFVNTSPLNEQAINLTRYPRVSGVTLHVAQTKPGDVMYIPTRWWHLVWSPVAAPGSPQQRNLAFTVEIATPPPPGTAPTPPSYVHRPAFTHELLLWALTYQRAGRRAHEARQLAGIDDAKGTGSTSPTQSYFDSVVIQSAGSCTAAKAAPPLA